MSTQLISAQTPSLPFGAPLPAPTTVTSTKVTSGTASRTARRSASAPSASARRTPQKANVAGVRRTREEAKSPRRSPGRSSVRSSTWRLDEDTKQAGRVGIASARQALASARRDRFDDFGELPEAA